MKAQAIFLILLTASAIGSAETAKPIKLTASAVQIAMVDAGDVQIPAEFRYAVYERLIERMRTSGTFQKVYRMGDHTADGVPDLVTLHTKVETYKTGCTGMILFSSKHSARNTAPKTSIDTNILR